MSGPLNHEETIQRGRDGLGCMCRHEWLIGEPHCDGPLTMGGGGLCWTCAHLRHCEEPVPCVQIECPPVEEWETNSYTVIDEIAVWNPDSIIKRPAGPASP